MSNKGSKVKAGANSRCPSCGHVCEERVNGMSGFISNHQYFWGHDVTALFNGKHTKFALKTLVYLFRQKGKTKALDLDLPSTT